jgi:hypothetical protein
MKKVYVLFIVAVLSPSLILAWLAARSMRDQQVLIERQRALLFQTICDRKANDLQQYLLTCQHEFSEKVSSLLPGVDAVETAKSFDDMVRKYWPLAEVGFVVTTTGQILSPRVYGRAEARDFLAQNSRFLANTQPAEVYLSPKRLSPNLEPNPSVPEMPTEVHKDTSSDGKSAFFCVQGCCLEKGGSSKFEESTWRALLQGDEFRNRIQTIGRR